AARLPDKVALVCGEQRVTYAQLDARANALANTLLARGVQRGDRVLVFADNTVEAVVSFWAVLKAGAVGSPVHRLAKPDKLSSSLQAGGAAARVPDGHLAPVFSGVKSEHLKVVVCSGAFDPAKFPQLPMMAWDEAVKASPAAPRRLGIDIDLAAI